MKARVHTVMSCPYCGLTVGLGSSNLTTKAVVVHQDPACTRFIDMPAREYVDAAQKHAKEIN